MKMLNDTVLCKNLDEVVEEKGGIIIPTKDKKYKRLEVVNVEEGPVKEGQEIYVLSSAGVVIPVDGVDYTVVKQKDILFYK